MTLPEADTRAKLIDSALHVREPAAAQAINTREIAQVISSPHNYGNWSKLFWLSLSREVNTIELTAPLVLPQHTSLADTSFKHGSETNQISLRDVKVGSIAI